MRLIFRLRALAELQIYFSFFCRVPLRWPETMEDQRRDEEKAKLRRDGATHGEEPGGSPAPAALQVLMRHWFTEVLRACNN